MPSVLIGFETPEDRPVRGSDYIMIMNALGRLRQASPHAMSSIESMSTYHSAFDLPCRLGWFIDAVQMVERVRLDMSTPPPNKDDDTDG